MPAAFRLPVDQVPFDAAFLFETFRPCIASSKVAAVREQRARTKLQDMILECCTLERDHRGSIVDHECRRGCGCATS